MITAVMSILFLTFGVYTHHRIFSSEYRLSTWQEGLKIYAPAVMIIAIILFIIYGIIALFTGIHVPIPSMPEFEMPNTNTLTNSLVNVYNSAAKNVSNATNTIANTLTNATNNIATNVKNNVANVATNANKAVNNVTVNLGQNKLANQNKNKVSRSFVETF
jgi:predicted PurR-regulated permease PerM